MIGGDDESPQIFVSNLGSVSKQYQFQWGIIQLVGSAVGQMNEQGPMVGYRNKSDIQKWRSWLTYGCMSTSSGLTPRTDA